MALRGTVTKLDRFLASLLYLFTLYWVLGDIWTWVTDISVDDKKTPLWSTLTYLYPPIRGTISVDYGSLLILIGLYIFVVRNRAIQYFVRFHTMQSLSLLTVWWLVRLSLAVVVVSGLLLRMGFVLRPESEVSIMLQWILGLMMIPFVGASVYSIFCAIMGKYGAVPVLSKAVKSHLRL